MKVENINNVNEKKANQCRLAKLRVEKFINKMDAMKRLKKWHALEYAKITDFRLDYERKLSLKDTQNTERMLAVDIFNDSGEYLIEVTHMWLKTYKNGIITYYDDPIESGLLTLHGGKENRAYKPKTKIDV